MSSTTAGVARTIGRIGEPAFGKVVDASGSSDHTLGPNGEDVYTPRDNPAIEWAGEGGYWCWADINDIPEVEAGERSAETLR